MTGNADLDKFLWESFRFAVFFALPAAILLTIALKYSVEKMVNNYNRQKSQEVFEYNLKAKEFNRRMKMMYPEEFKDE